MTVSAQGSNAEGQVKMVYCLCLKQMGRYYTRLLIISTQFCFPHTLSDAGSYSHPHMQVMADSTARQAFLAVCSTGCAAVCQRYVARVLQLFTPNFYLGSRNRHLLPCLLLTEAETRFLPLSQFTSQLLLLPTV